MGTALYVNTGDCSCRHTKDYFVCGYWGLLCTSILRTVRPYWGLFCTCLSIVGTALYVDSGDCTAILRTTLYVDCFVHRYVSSPSTEDCFVQPYWRLLCTSILWTACVSILRIAVHSHTEDYFVTHQYWCLLFVRQYWWLLCTLMLERALNIDAEE